MITLGLDTATYLVSMGLVRDGKIIGEMSFTGERRHLRKLIPWLHQLLTESGVAIEQLSGLAAVLGPGSFTGLRIGLATLQGFALAWKIPTVGLYSVDVIAAGLPLPKACVLVHSRADAFFYAHYDQAVRQGGIAVATLAEIVAQLPENIPLVSPQLAEIKKAAALLPHPEKLNLVLAPVSGARVAQLGELSLNQGAGQGPETLVATYWRDSFAEENTCR